MKTGAKADLAKNKGFSEIKKYIQKLYDCSKTVQWFFILYLTSKIIKLLISSDWTHRLSISLEFEQNRLSFLFNNDFLN